jgi:hypothetical protein
MILWSMGRASDVKNVRAALFEGLYDGSSGRSTPAVRSRFGCADRARRVRLLNPEVGEVDRTSRRFSLLEVD